ncbi:hypothetical protein BGZ46_003854 [Entomortierella lignicola]|nr:hypothetical protein BGZ46_003854 [Entomortierella lignicola]
MRQGNAQNFFYGSASPTFSTVFNPEIVGLIGEVKSPEERYDDFRYHDHWKLIQVDKAGIGEQITKGIQNTRIVCIQAFVYVDAMYILKKDQSGVCVLYRAAEGYIPRSVSDTPGTISIFQYSKALNESIVQCDLEDIRVIREVIHQTILQSIVGHCSDDSDTKYLYQTMDKLKRCRDSCRVLGLDSNLDCQSESLHGEIHSQTTDKKYKNQSKAIFISFEDDTKGCSSS